MQTDRNNQWIASIRRQLNVRRMFAFVIALSLLAGCGPSSTILSPAPAATFTSQAVTLSVGQSVTITAGPPSKDGYAVTSDSAAVKLQAIAAASVTRHTRDTDQSIITFSGQFTIVATSNGTATITVRRLPDNVIIAEFTITISLSTPTPTPTPTLTPTPTPGSLTVNPTGYNFGAVGVLQMFTITETNYLGPFTVTTSAGSVATATISANIVSVTAQGSGSATITVADNHGQTQTIAITVTTLGGVLQ